MKRLISLVSLIVLTATPVAAFAGGYQWTNNSKTIQGNVVDSKQAAYDMGFEMIKNYQSKSSKELRDEFKSACFPLLMQKLPLMSFFKITVRLPINQY